MEDRLRRIYARHRRRTYHNRYAKSKIKWFIIIPAIIIGLIICIGIGYQRKIEEDKRKTIGNLLLTALQPVGNTMYIWGGGWDDEDTDSGGEAVRIGVSPRWAEFASKQDGTYDFETTRFQRENGLDCSG